MDLDKDARAKKFKMYPSMECRYFQSSTSHVVVNNVNPFNTVGCRSKFQKDYSKKRNNIENDDNFGNNVKTPHTGTSNGLVHEIMQDYEVNTNIFINEQNSDHETVFTTNQPTDLSQRSLNLSSRPFDTDYAASCSRSVPRTSFRKRMTRKYSYNNKRRHLSANETYSMSAPNEIHHAEKTTYCRPINDMYSEQFYYKTMQKNARLQNIVRKLVIERQREKQREHWNNYINELKNKHGYYNNDTTRIPQYESNDRNISNFIGDYYNMNPSWLHSEPTQSLIEDFYRACSNVQPSKYPRQYGYVPCQNYPRYYESKSFCYPTCPEGTLMMMNNGEVPDHLKKYFSRTPVLMRAYPKYEQEEPIYSDINNTDHAYTQDTNIFNKAKRYQTQTKSTGMQTDIKIQNFNCLQDNPEDINHINKQETSTNTKLRSFKKWPSMKEFPKRKEMCIEYVRKRRVNGKRFKSDSTKGLKQNSNSKLLKKTDKPGLKSREVDLDSLQDIEYEGDEDMSQDTRAKYGKGTFQSGDQSDGMLQELNCSCDKKLNRDLCKAILLNANCACKRLQNRYSNKSILQHDGTCTCKRLQNQQLIEALLRKVRCSCERLQSRSRRKQKRRLDHCDCKSYQNGDSDEAKPMEVKCSCKRFLNLDSFKKESIFKCLRKLDDSEVECTCKNYEKIDDSRVECACKNVSKRVQEIDNIKVECVCESEQDKYDNIVECACKHPKTTGDIDVECECKDHRKTHEAEIECACERVSKRMKRLDNNEVKCVCDSDSEDGFSHRLSKCISRTFCRSYSKSLSSTLSKSFSKIMMKSNDTNDVQCDCKDARKLGHIKVECACEDSKTVGANQVKCFCEQISKGIKDIKVECTCKDPKKIGDIEVNCACKDTKKPGYTGAECACKEPKKLSEAEVKCACYLKEPEETEVECACKDSKKVGETSIECTCKYPKKPGDTEVKCACKDPKKKGDTEAECACKGPKDLEDTVIECVCKESKKLSEAEVECACKDPKKPGDTDVKCVCKVECACKDPKELEETEVKCACKEPKELSEAEVKCICKDLKKPGDTKLECACQEPKELSEAEVKCACYPKEPEETEVKCACKEPKKLGDTEVKCVCKVECACKDPKELEETEIKCACKEPKKLSEAEIKCICKDLKKPGDTELECACKEPKELNAAEVKCACYPKEPEETEIECACKELKKISEAEVKCDCKDLKKLGEIEVECACKRPKKEGDIKVECACKDPKKVVDREVKCACADSNKVGDVHAECACKSAHDNKKIGETEVECACNSVSKRMKKNVDSKIQCACKDPNKVGDTDVECICERLNNIDNTEVKCVCDDQVSEEEVSCILIGKNISRTFSNIMMKIKETDGADCDCKGTNEIGNIKVECECESEQDIHNKIKCTCRGPETVGDTRVDCACVPVSKRTKKIDDMEVKCMCEEDSEEEFVHRLIAKSISRSLSNLITTKSISRTFSRSFSNLITKMYDTELECACANEQKTEVERAYRGICRSISKLIEKINNTELQCTCESVQDIDGNKVECGCKISQRKDYTDIISACKLLQEILYDVKCTCKQTWNIDDDEVECTCKLSHKNDYTDIICACKRLQNALYDVKCNCQRICKIDSDRVGCTCKSSHRKYHTNVNCACKRLQNTLYDLKCTSKRMWNIEIDEEECECKKLSKFYSYDYLLDNDEVPCTDKTVKRDYTHIKCGCKRLQKKLRDLKRTSKRMWNVHIDEVDCDCKLPPKNNPDCDCKFTWQLNNDAVKDKSMWNIDNVDIGCNCKRRWNIDNVELECECKVSRLVDGTEVEGSCKSLENIRNDDIECICNRMWNIDHADQECECKCLHYTNKKLSGREMLRKSARNKLKDYDRKRPQMIDDIGVESSCNSFGKLGTWNIDYADEECDCRSVHQLTDKKSSDKSLGFINRDECGTNMTLNLDSNLGRSKPNDCVQYLQGINRNITNLEKLGCRCEKSRNVRDREESLEEIVRVHEPSKMVICTTKKNLEMLKSNLANIKQYHCPCKRLQNRQIKQIPIEINNKSNVQRFVQNGHSNVQRPTQNSLQSDLQKTMRSTQDDVQTPIEVSHSGVQSPVQNDAERRMRFEDTTKWQNIKSDGQSSPKNIKTSYSRMPQPLKDNKSKLKSINSKECICGPQPDIERTVVMALERTTVKPLQNIEDKLDKLIASFNSFVKEVKSSECYKKRIKTPSSPSAPTTPTTSPSVTSKYSNKQPNPEVLQPQNSICRAQKTDQVLYTTVQHNNPRNGAISDNNVIRLKRNVSNTKLEKILKEEIEKSNKIKRDIKELLHTGCDGHCSPDISYDIPTKDVSISVPSLLSKTLSSDNDIEEIATPMRSGSRMTIAVNTDPLGFLGLLRISAEMVRQLLSYMPLVYQYSPPWLLQASHREAIAHYVCSICGASFRRPSQLSDHIERNHDLGRTRDCCVCRHVLDLQHDKIGLFKCKYCGKMFARAYCCELHQQTCAKLLGKRHDVASNLTILR